MTQICNVVRKYLASNKSANLPLFSWGSERERQDRLSGLRMDKGDCNILDQRKQEQCAKIIMEVGNGVLCHRAGERGGEGCGMCV